MDMFHDLWDKFSTKHQLIGEMTSVGLKTEEQTDSGKVPLPWYEYSCYHSELTDLFVIEKQRKQISGSV